MVLNDIRQLLAAELSQVDQCILNALHSNIPLIGQIGQHIINSGGKRLRPICVLLSAKACDYQGKQHIDLAAIIEFIHTATLLHDDVVDESLRRRGVDTANALWGNSASVLVGDFVYSRSFQMMTTLNSLDIMQILSDATNQIAEGEVLQLINKHDPATSEENYLEVIRLKTATLFQAAMNLGGIIAKADDTIIKALTTYGLNIGIAFQLVDDMLDYSGENIGKNIGDDLAEGKPTLPLIRALQIGTHEQRRLIEIAIKQGKLDELAVIKETISSTCALDYCFDKAKHYTDLAITALQALPDNQYRQALIEIAHVAISRKS